VPDAREVAHDLEVIEHLVAREHLFQLLAERRIVPLTLAQIIERAAFRLFAFDLEHPIKRRIGRKDPDLRRFQHHAR
jgi:hypothetical protein